MFRIKDLNAFYSHSQILKEVSFQLKASEVLCLLGRNGAGKTTLLKALMGTVKHTGSIKIEGMEISSLEAHLRPALGLALVPQGRRLFSELSVMENLKVALGNKMPLERQKAVLNNLFQLFPVLKPRLDQISATLSGGEQQMLAIARAMCLQPRILLLDEPTEGLMPSMINTIREAILKLQQQGMALILVEQRVETVLPISQKVAFMENGQIKLFTTPRQIKNNPELLRKYVGVRIG